MNLIEKKMVEVLKKLSGEYGVFEIKAEFEAEASRIEELMRLKDIISTANLPLILKIGGVEAITDIYMGLSLGAHGIVAPMAETAFAVDKFLNAIDTYVAKDNADDIEFAVNIETKTACENFDEILNLKNIKRLSSITVGRVDLVGSYGYGRDKIETQEITDVVEGVFTKSREAGFRTAMGGGISTDAILNINYFTDKGLIDKFETRKVVFDAKNARPVMRDAILHAVEFEYLWLVSKRRYYGNVHAEDEKRIPMIEQRMKAEGYNIPSID